MKTKKYITGMMAAAGLLLATSCSDDLSIAGISGDTQKVTFSLGLEGQIQTRGVDIIGGNNYNDNTRISDGTRAKHLILEVYTDDGEPYAFYEANSKTHFNRYETNDAAFPKTDLTITLEKNKPYRVVFWADTPNNTYYETDDLRNIGIRYDDKEEMNNDELRDAFCFSGDLSEAETEKTITLSRPLAQINVGTTAKDWETVEKNYPVEKSKIKINYVGNRFNLVENKAVIGESSEATGDPTEGMTVADYQYATIPYNQTKIDNKEVAENANYLRVNIKQGDDGKFTNSETPEKYHWLSMCYILVPSEDNDHPSTVDITELKFTKDGAGYELEPFANGLTNVPVQRNHRTNIIGSILTEEQSFTVSLDANFAGDFNKVNNEGWDGEIADGVSYEIKTQPSQWAPGIGNGINFYVSSAKGLQWISDRTNKVQFTEADIPGWFKGNLQDYKDYVLKIIETRALIDGGAKQSNLESYWTFDESTIYLTKDIDWAAEMPGVLFTPLSSSQGNGTSEPITANSFKGTFDGQEHTISNLKINNANNTPPACSGFIATATDNAAVKNLRLYAADITANWNVGGFVGFYRYSNNNKYSLTIENCQLEASTIKATVGNSPSNDANIGGIVGSIMAAKSATIENCQVRDTKLESDYIAGGIIGLTDAITLISGCEISDVAVIINEMNDQTNEYEVQIPNQLSEKYWICGNKKSEGNLSVPKVPNVYNNVYRNIFYGTRERSADTDKHGMGEIDHLPLKWFPELLGEWANGIMLMSHVTGTPSYTPNNQSWCAGLYINTNHTGQNKAENVNASYTLCGNTQNGKPLYALNVQNPGTPATCYGVYLTGTDTATIKDLVINGDPSITAGIYLDNAAKVVLENVAVYDVVNTIQDNSVPNDATLTVTNCDLRGTTQYGGSYKEVTFTGTTFSKGSGTTANKANKSVIPGTTTMFDGCVFEQGFTVDLSKLPNGSIVTFKNCKLAGADGTQYDLTAENVAQLGIEETDSNKYGFAQ